MTSGPFAWTAIVLTIPGKLHSKESFLGRCQRNKDRIILILPEGGLALGSKNTDHRKGNLLDTDDLTNRIDSSKKVFHHGLSKQTNLGGSIQILLGERAA